MIVFVFVMTRLFQAFDITLIVQLLIPCIILIQTDSWTNQTAYTNGVIFILFDMNIGRERERERERESRHYIHVQLYTLYIYIHVH